MIEPEINVQEANKSLCTQPKNELYDLMIVWDGSVLSIVGKVTVISGVTRHGTIGNKPIETGTGRLFYVKDGKTSYISDKHVLYFGPYEKAFDRRHKVQETRKETESDTM